MNKTGYKTKQKQELLEYLKSCGGDHITANDVCEHFKECGSPIGLTTVYRHLERMVDDGVVSKYIIDANTPACFEYVRPEEHSHKGTCFHCKCEKCGRLIHLHCEELDGFKTHLSEHHRLQIDPKRTVFYGIWQVFFIPPPAGRPG